MITKEQETKLLELIEEVVFYSNWREQALHRKEKYRLELLNRSLDLVRKDLHSYLHGLTLPSGENESLK